MGGWVGGWVMSGWVDGCIKKADTSGSDSISFRVPADDKKATTQLV